MRKKLLAMVLVACCSIGAGAQTFPAAWSARFQTVIDSLTQHYLTNGGDTIGVTMAVSVPGIGTWQGAAGSAGPGRHMTTNTTVTVASNTKLFTAVILLKLQEANILSLDDHIGRWIHVPLHDVDTSATIRQCLQHETGLYDYMNDAPSFWDWIFYDVNAFWTYRRAVDSIGAPHFPKGRNYSYSNTNYLVAAWIIELATGNTYRQNLQQYITTPLGLTRTLDGATDTVAMNAAPASWCEVYGVWYQPTGSTALASISMGVGQIVSTGKDMAAFYQALFNPSSTFLTEASRRQLVKEEPVSSYALGVGSFYAPAMQAPIYSHSGSIAGYHSWTYYDRSTNASLFWATNSEDADWDRYYYTVTQAYRDYFPKRQLDAAITAIAAPQATSCNASITPLITLTNRGTSPLSIASLRYSVDGGAPVSYSWSGNLAAGASQQVQLPVYASAHGRHSFKAWIHSANGTPELYAFNDTLSTVYCSNLTTAYNGYFSENFEGATTPVLTWSAANIPIKDWAVTKLAGKSGNHSLARPTYDNTYAGDVTCADMPLVKLQAGATPSLNFSYAYKTFPGKGDSLQVLLSADCGATWTSLFYKGGLDLSLGDSTEDRYVPQTAAEWHGVSLPLTGYAGDVLVRFRHTSGRSNILYLDDISIGTPTGLALASAPAMRVYPNPANDQVTVSGLPGTTTVSLTDMTGKMLQQVQTNGGSAVISVGDLAAGMYLLSSPYGTTKLVKK